MKTRGWIIICWLIICINNVNSQILVYQDIFKGGTTGDSFDPWNMPVNGVFQLHIEPGSTIKKAFLFVTVYFSPEKKIIYFNNYPILLNEQNAYNNDYYYIHNSDVRRIRTLMVDVTNFVHPSQNTYSLSAFVQPIYITEGLFCEFYLYVAYENPGLPEMCTSVFLNNIQPNANMLYSINNLNPINTLKNVGLAINAGSMCDTILDGSFVEINNLQIGLIGGQDDGGSVSCSGIRGSFYYQNETLFGLGNDTADSLMNGTDGIANIESYLNSNTTLNLLFKYQTSNLGSQTNPIHQIFLTYTTPCDTFSVTHTPDTTVCHGAQLPLFVTGGQAYEWTPQVGLSCYDCPNPVFTADSTMHYSIRIWNNDSCSKVLPLHIVVEEALPHFDFDISPSECGDSTGSVIITPILNGFSYINQTTQDTNSTGIFSGLESGFYPITIVNNSACSFDTVVFIPETLSVNADFIASPNAGISPLPVAFTNTSSHANSYQWIYENQSSTQENIIHTFQQDGIYPVMLIAYGNSILCADTAYDTIYVYLPIEVEIPNIFTPNSDQNNDQWGIKINVPAEVDLQIFNRWGEIIVNRKEEVLSPGFIPLWDGGEHVGGVYYYVLRLKTDFEKKEFKGNLTLVR